MYKVEVSNLREPLLLCLTASAKQKVAPVTDEEQGENLRLKNDSFGFM